MMSSQLRTKRTGSTFVSYVNLDSPQTAQSQSLNTTASSTEVLPPVSLTPHLIPGEILISEANNVLKFNSFSELKTGISGAIFCTSFKLSFVTMEQFTSSNPARSQLLSENDICLINIDSIYQVSGSRKKKLQLQSNMNLAVEVLQIHCKDFRIYTFSFKFSPAGHSSKVVNYILHHAFPTNIELLFGCTPRKNDIENSSNGFSPYDSIEEWNMEMERCKCSGWKVTGINSNFELCDTLPRYFVVPKDILDYEFDRLAAMFTNRRIPFWSWSHPKGASLLKVTTVNDLGFPQDVAQYNSLMKSILGDFHEVDLDLVCPTVREIHSCFSRLQQLCMPANEHEFYEQETHYLSALESSKWLSCVSTCLKEALKASKCLAQRKSVVIKEKSGFDLSSVLASLVQLILDPYARTQEGFQNLVEKEWIASGHPFTDRLGHVKGDPNTQESPVFLLFLDCVWQMLMQFPSSFEFSETYLTNLWDCTHISTFDTFLFNNNKTRNRAKRKGIFFYMWDWSRQLTSQDIDLFRNPLYILNSDSSVNKSIPLTRPKSEGNVLNHRETSFILDHYGGGDLLPDKKSFLRGLDYTVKSLKVWSQCYYRWIPKAQIVGGDPAALFLQNLIVANEIEQLKKALNHQYFSNVQLRHRRLASDESRLASRLNSCHISQDSRIVTSSFPYAPPGPIDWSSFHTVSAGSCLYVSGANSDIELED